MPRIPVSVVAFALTACIASAQPIGERCNPSQDPCTWYYAYPSCASTVLRIEGAGDPPNCAPAGDGSILTVTKPNDAYIIHWAVSPGDHEITIRAMAAGVQIESITIARNGVSTSLDANVTVKLGSDSGDYPIAYIGSILEDNASPPAGQVFVKLRGRGFVAADVTALEEVGITIVDNLNVGGNFGALNGSTPTTLGVLGYLIDVGVGGDLLGALQVDGDLDGNAIKLLDVKGAIGDPLVSAAGSIQTPHNIADITAGVIYSTISVDGGEGDIALLRTRNVTGYTGGGHFYGSLDANELYDHTNLIPGRILIAGDFGGSLTLAEPLANRYVDHVVAPVVISGSFLDGASINLPEEGLAGHILIADAGTGEWEDGAVVSVDDIDIEAPDYDTLPDEIGGSAVGLWRFAQHGLACEPRHQEIVIVRTPGTAWIGEGEPTCEWLASYAVSHGLQPTSVVIRLRGPVMWVGDEPNPDEVVTIERREFGTSTFVPATGFTSSIIPGGGSDYSSIEVLGVFAMYHEYRMTPRSDLEEGDLVCDSTEGGPPLLDYRFAVYFDCRGTFLEMFDHNEDGVLDYLDLLNWLINNQDLNFDGNINAIDFEILYDAILYYENLE